jgi:hypothetical protein
VILDRLGNLKFHSFCWVFWQRLTAGV